LLEGEEAEGHVYSNNEENDYIELEGKDEH